MVKRSYFTNFLYPVFILAVVAGLVSGCHPAEQKKYVLTGDTVLDGKNLVQLHCAKCHELVPVNALTKNVWKVTTLPNMSKYFGINSYLDGYFKNVDTGLTLLEWQSIVAYYKKMAPDSLPVAKKPLQPSNSLAGFTVKVPQHNTVTAFTTLTAIDQYNHRIYTSDDEKRTLQEWDENLKPARSVKLPSTAVSADFIKNKDGGVSAVLSCIGVLGAVDFPNGKVVTLDPGAANLTPIAAQSELRRPVQTVSADFNKDGLADRVICEQGYLQGGVYLLKQGLGNTFTRVSISEQPGAVKAITGDFNKDGWPDVMVLFGRVDEELMLFLNDQHGGFTKRVLLRFPPVYGSSNFELADLDHDGNLDLIYSAGFNFGKSRILKPYHGLYIYKNSGDWNFKQQWFYPVNGLTNFVTADFKGDGKTGIVTTAFYADMIKNPAESCMYFEQNDAFSFKPYTLPVNKYGRWMTMGIGDINNDGKPDIVLGNYARMFYFQPHVTRSWDLNIPFIVLQNNFK